MTMTEARDNGATGDATDLSDADARLLARADWHASEPKLTGKELAERYGRSRKWGQNQAAAARAEAAPDRAAALLGVPRPTPVPVPRPERKPRPAAQPQPAGVPWLLRYGRMAGFVLVAVVCAVMSYHHIRDLATLVGLDNPEWVPLGIDGLMVVCTCTLMIDKGAGRSSPRAAQLGLALGIAGSLAANALAVRPGTDLWSIVRMVLACYPTATLAVVLHLVFLRTVGDR